MLTLNFLLNIFGDALYSAGAHHVSVGAVSHHFGMILTRHWHITIKWRP